MQFETHGDLLVRAALFATAGLFLGIGCYGIVDPQGLMASVGVSADTVSGISELRANYGTLQVGLGLIVLYAALHPAWSGFGLILGATYMGGLLAGRILSLFLEGPPDELVILVATTELLGVLVNLSAWWHLQRSE